VLGHPLEGGYLWRHIDVLLKMIPVSCMQGFLHLNVHELVDEHE
jgi:hypothetical protein